MAHYVINAGIFQVYIINNFNWFRYQKIILICLFHLEIASFNVKIKVQTPAIMRTITTDKKQCG